MKPKYKRIPLDGEDFWEMIERGIAEDREKGIAESEELDFDKLDRKWKTKARINEKSLPLTKSIEIEAQLEGDKLALALLSPMPDVPISVYQNEIQVGDLRIAITLKKNNRNGGCGI